MKGSSNKDVIFNTLQYRHHVNYENMPMQFTENLRGVKIENFHMKNLISQNIDCGYTLGPPRRCGSNEYPKSMFWIKKNNRYTPAYPSFTIYKSGVQGGTHLMDIFPELGFRIHFLQ